MEIRPIQQSDRRLPTVLEESEGLYLSPFCLIENILRMIEVDMATLILITQLGTKKPLK